MLNNADIRIAAHRQIYPHGPPYTTWDYAITSIHHENDDHDDDHHHQNHNCSHNDDDQDDKHHDG